MDLGYRIALRRKELKMTQQKLAEALNISFQAVSSWERGESFPETEKLLTLAKVLCTSVSWLFGEESTSGEAWDLKDQMFSTDNMYRFVNTTAHAKNMKQTLIALHIMKEKHQGQTRKGKDHVPYIIHPLMMACHAFAMGIAEDDLIASILLHDVVEDCEIKAEELEVSDTIREVVKLVTFTIPEGMTEQDAMICYYKRIKENKLAAMVKLLDRCNNVSTMASGFSREKIADYIHETEKYVIPVLDYVKHHYDEYYNAAFLLKYQLRSVMESLKRTL